MPLDLLLETTGDYERMHQLVLFVLLQRGEKDVRASAIERLYRTLRVSPSLFFESRPAG